VNGTAPSGAGTEVGVPVAVAGVEPLRSGYPVRHADSVGPVDIMVDERGQQLAQQIRRRGSQLFVQDSGKLVSDLRARARFWV
jgi:hypothetical protein